MENHYTYIRDNVLTINHNSDLVQQPDKKLNCLDRYLDFLSIVDS